MSTSPILCQNGAGCIILSMLASHPETLCRLLFPCKCAAVDDDASPAQPRSCANTCLATGTPVTIRCTATPTASSSWSARGKAMTRHGFAHRLEQHATTARQRMPSMTGKRIFLHLLRHSCAAHTLEATGDIRKVSLWLGHASIQSTEIYLRSDPIGKLDVLAARLHAPYLARLRPLLMVALQPAASLKRRYRLSATCRPTRLPRGIPAASLKRS